MEKEILPKIENKEKPPFLYHGSAHTDIEELEPRKESVRDPDEGAVVFATQELALASIFMASGVVESGKFNIPYAVIKDSREHFIENDRGGHIYVVPSESFYSDPNKGLGEYEWITKQKVKVTEKIEYPSTLDAMLKNGVQVYFVDDETHKKIKESKDFGFSILKTLVSENQQRGINIKGLEE